MTVPTKDSPELLALFSAYTGGPDGIGAHFAESVAAGARHDPLIVATGTDIALFAGGGRPPSIQPYRLSTRGFRELAAISHLGPAVATLAAMYDTDPDGQWRTDAERLLQACKAARAANSPALWRDRIAVDAFTGREDAIAAMTDYACDLTERRLARALDDPTGLTMSSVVQAYLGGPAEDLPVPFNRVMIATFFLTGMDLAHRLITWFDAVDVAWERAMVIMAGRAGRPTAGVTEESNSVAGVIRAAARGRLPQDRLFIAPHAPVFPTFDGTDLTAVAALEVGYRQLWASLRGTGELGVHMFPGYPRFAPPTTDRVRIDRSAVSVPEKPAVRAPDDWLSLITRLRVVMEDPRQLLSGAVTDYACRQLLDNGNDPSAVVVPGLDGEPYLSDPAPLDSV